MITGEYNSELYRIYLEREGEVPELLYTAGNSPYDSQSYVPAIAGVGLQAMRSFCIKTAREMAEERNEPYGGVVRIERGK